MHNERINPKPESSQPVSEIVEKILAAIKGINFGSVEIVIHEGRIVQIERKEKVRFNQDTSAQNKVRP